MYIRDVLSAYDSTLYVLAGDGRSEPIDEVDELECTRCHFVFWGWGENGDSSEDIEDISRMMIGGRL